MEKKIPTNIVLFSPVDTRLSNGVRQEGKSPTSVEVALSKRELLLEAAIALFGDNGFWNTSTASIAKHAGVATGTLFNYFASKEELIREVMVYLKREMISEAAAGFNSSADLRDQLELLWYNGLKWGMANWSRFHLMEQSDMDAIGEPYADMMTLFAHGVETGCLQPLAPELIAELMFRQAQAVVEYLLWNTALSDAERNAHLQTGFDVFWNGIIKH